MIPGSSIQELLWDLFSTNLLPTVLIVQISLVKIIKNAPWRILVPRAVACDNLHLRASMYYCHVSAFCVIGNSSEFPITIRVSKDTLTFIDFCLYLENLTRIDFRIGYLENLQNASLVFFILIMLSLFWQHNEPSYFHNPIAF